MASNGPALAARYHDAAAYLAVQVAALAVGQYSDTRPAWAEAAAGMIVAGQSRAQALADGYLVALGAGVVAAAPPPAGTVGFGRVPLVPALAASGARAVELRRRGWPAERVQRVAQAGVGRLAHVAVLEAGRGELAAQMAGNRRVAGWRWRSRGTCGACLASDNGAVRPGGDVQAAHPGCQCVPEVVLRGEERAPLGRPTGTERWQGLPREEQDRLLGPEKAELVRSGAARLADLVAQEQVVAGGPAVVVEQAAERVRRRRRRR